MHSLSKLQVGPTSLLLYTLTPSHPHTLTRPHPHLHSMTRLLHELEELRERCMQLESMLSTTGKEIEHLKLENQAAQEDLLSLRKSSVSDAV